MVPLEKIRYFILCSRDTCILKKKSNNNLPWNIEFFLNLFVAVSYFSTWPLCFPSFDTKNSKTRLKTERRKWPCSRSYFWPFLVLARLLYLRLLRLAFSALEWLGTNLALLGMFFWLVQGNLDNQAVSIPVKNGGGSTKFDCACVTYIVVCPCVCTLLGNESFNWFL